MVFFAPQWCPGAGDSFSRCSGRRHIRGVAEGRHPHGPTLPHASCRRPNHRKTKAKQRSRKTADSTSPAQRSACLRRGRGAAAPASKKELAHVAHIHALGPPPGALLLPASSLPSASLASNSPSEPCRRYVAGEGTSDPLPCLQSPRPEIHVGASSRPGASSSAGTSTPAAAGGGAGGPHPPSPLEPSRSARGGRLNLPCARRPSLSLDSPPGTGPSSLSSLAAPVGRAATAAGEGRRAHCLGRR
jgi:hypothetical protein